MRLWILNHYAGFPELVPATRTFELSRLLAERGWDVTVVAAGFNHYTFRDDFEYAGSKLTEQSRDGVRWVFLRTVPYSRNGLARIANVLSYASAARCWAETQSVKPDVVIGTSVHPFAPDLARELAARWNIPFVYEITDLWPETLLDLGQLRSGSVGHKFLSALEVRAFREASGVIGILPGIEDYAREAHGIRLASFCYVPNGVRRCAVREVPAATEVPGRIVYVGGFAAAHGIDVVLHAAAHLQRNHADLFEFLLYGDGPERLKLQDLARSLALKNTQFMGAIDKAHLPAVLATAESTLCTGRPMRVHRWGTSFNKLFDYFAAARPVIFAIDSSNNPVAAADAGISVAAGAPLELAHAIETIHGLSPGDRTTMGLRGREFLLREHVFESTVDRLERFLVSCAAQPRDGSQGISAHS